MNSIKLEHQSIVVIKNQINQTQSSSINSSCIAECLSVLMLPATYGGVCLRKAMSSV
jgi:Cft2 family RNA processing exonuclease